jgi:hypothetical protein
MTSIAPMLKRGTVAPRWRRIACAIAAVATLASVGCNRGKRTYPTISARSPDGGNVNVHGTYNHCPQVLFVATPDHVLVGQSIGLTAFASDMDSDTLTYAWSATSGAIADAHAMMTNFRCVTRGAVAISLTVSDSACDSTTSGEVLCQSADAGAPDAGAGGAAGNSGQAGAGGQTGRGGSTGGAGGVGTGGAAGSGAGGSIGRGGTTGSGGTGASSGTGGTACLETNPPPERATDCQQCLMMNENPATDGCCPIAASDPTGFTLCQAASACMRAGGPPVGMCNVNGDSTSCYCGTNLATCDTAGKANGPCVSQITAAAGRNVITKMTDSPSAAQVLQRFGDPNYAVGRAANIHGITPFCPTECGIGQ